jgi:membrane protein
MSTRMIRFSKEILTIFFRSNPFQNGAALAYYAVFSLLPMILIITVILGYFFGEKEVSDQIFSQFNHTFGPKVSKQIQEIVSHREINQNSTLATVVGFFVLMLSSSAMLRQLHVFFNRIWRIKVKRKREVQSYLFRQFISFLLLIGLVFFVLISTGVSSYFLEFSDRLRENYAFSYGYEMMVSFFIIGTIFTLLFSILSDAVVHWKPAIVGGFFTAFLFSIGKTIIGYILITIHIDSVFGSASVLAILMLWVYYTSQIIFFGAAFIQVISERMGHQIRPNKLGVMVEIIEVE